LSSLYSYLFFHVIAEMFSIVVAFGIFMIAWNSRRFIDNNYLMFIGIAYLFVGILDLFHALGYTGMGIFQGYDTNLPTQLWIAARYLQSLSLLAAPFYLRRKLRIYPVLMSYTLIVAVLLGTIFFGNVFPDCFVEGTGLTPFKKISEYVISVILLGSIALLLKNREEFSEPVLRLLVASILVTIGSELAFTFYVSAYGFSNLVGHLLKIAAFYLVYKAIIVTGLVSPYDLLFRNLKRNEEALLKFSHDLGERVKELDCLYKISRLIERDLPPEVLYQEITEILPPSWQYPEITCARIMLEGEEFKTDGFRQTDWGQSSDVIVKGERLGRVEVIYLEEMPEIDEGPFLEEERSLINAITERLGNIIQRRRAEDELRRHRENLEELVEARTSEINWVNKELQQEIAERGRVEEAVRKSEASLAEAQRIARLGSWEWNIETNELFWSDEIYRIFGLSFEEFDATYEAFLGTVHPEDKELVERSVEDALYKNKPYSIEHRIVLPDGEVRIVHERAEVAFNEEGKAVRMIGTVQDITERRRAEDAVKEAERKLEEQRAKAIHTDRLRSLGEMAAGIAHELNQPLLGIRGLAEHVDIALERGWKLSEGDIQEKLKLIIDQADRMSHVIEHTRMFGRKADRADLMPVDVNDVIESSLVIIGPQLKSSGLLLESELGQGLPRVLANPFSLEEVILNLVSNARDAMIAKGQADGAPGSISLRTYLDGDGAKRYIKIEVTDTGAGIPDEIMEKVFDPFFTTKDPEKGTGLGLAISSSLIEGVGGHIELKSRPGQGTTAVISLPAVTGVPEEEK
jgi:PAS domain S-box-containing protein